MSETKDHDFDPEQEENKKQFSAIWKQTMEQLELFGEAVVKATQTARIRLDATFLRRERDRLYQQLGEDTFVLIESGKVKAHQALRDILERIHSIGRQLDDVESSEAEEENAKKAESVKKEKAQAEKPAEKEAAASKSPKAETGKKAASAKKSPARKKAAKKASAKKTSAKKTPAKKAPAKKKAASAKSVKPTEDMSGEKPKAAE